VQLLEREALKGARELHFRVVNPERQFSQGGDLNRYGEVWLGPYVCMNIWNEIYRHLYIMDYVYVYGQVGPILGGVLLLGPYVCMNIWNKIYRHLYIMDYMYVYGRLGPILGGVLLLGPCVCMYERNNI